MRDDDHGNNSSRPRSRLRGKAAVVTLSGFIVVLLVGLVASLSPNSPMLGGNGPEGYVACLARETPKSFCGRPVSAASARQGLPYVDAARLEQEAFSIAVLTADGGWCRTGKPDTCAESKPNLPPTESDVETARKLLNEAGYPSYVVRLARPDDPAPTGALLYAVEVEGVCIVGDTEYVPRKSYGSAFEMVGLLPDGTCLDE